MAETYKGLTIRIGGDTSGLEKSLRSISSSISQTESQLRKLRQALNFDSDNTDAMSKSLELLGNKAIETRQKVQTLNSLIKEMGSQNVKLLGDDNYSVQTVSQLADATEDASARAAEARKNYAAITEELAKFYSPINKTVTETGKLSGEVDDATQKVREFAQAWSAAHEGKAFSASDFIDEVGLDNAIAQFKELGILTEEEAQQLRDLRETYANAFDENQIAQAVSELDKMNTDLIKAEAEASNVTQQFSEMSRAASMSTYGEGIDQQLRSIESVAQSVRSELDQLDDALALDPTNVDLISAKMRDLYEASDLAQAKVDALEEKMERLKADGADKLAEGMSDVRTEVERTAQAYDDATAEVKELEAQLREAQSAMSSLANGDVDLTREFTSACESVRELENELAEAKAALESLDGNDELSGDFEEARLRVEQLEAELSEAKVAMDSLNSADSDLSSEFVEARDKVQQLASELVDLRATQEQTEAAFKNASLAEEYVETSNQISITKAQIAGLNDEIANTGAVTGISFESIEGLALSLSTTVTPLLQQVGSSIVESTNEIDSAYRDMRKTVEGTEEDFESLREAAIEFSTTHVTSADQILSIQAIGGELGIAVDELETFSEVISNIDVATDLDAEDAATALGQLSNIMGITEDQFVSFSDALVRLGNNGASTESQIVDIATRIGSMGSIVGMTVPEVLAWSSAIASTGQNSEAAGTAISNTISDIETAVASGGDSLQGFADVAGMSAEEFANAWSTSPSDALKAFIEGLVQIEADGGSATTTLSDLGITATRQVQAIEGLMQTVDGLDDAITMSNDAWNGVSDQWGEAGDAAREADEKAEGFSGSLSRLQNIAQDLAAELGDSLTPVISAAADFLADLYDGFASLDDSTNLAIIGVGAFVAALGPMMLLGSGIGKFFSGLSETLSSVGTAVKSASSITDLIGSFTKVGTSATDLASILSGSLVVGGVLLAVGAIASLVDWFQQAEEEERLFKRATEDLADASLVMRENMTDAADSVKSYTEMMDDAEQSTDDVIQELADLADSFDEINESAQLDLNGLRNAEIALNEYNGRADLTTEEVGKFKAAIEQLNSVCGTNYEVVRDSSGVYYVMEDGARAATEEIYALIEAQRQQVIEQAQMQKLSEYYETYYDQLAKYSEVSSDYQEAAKQMNEARQAYIDAWGSDPDTDASIGLRMNTDEMLEYQTWKNTVSELNDELETQSSLLDESARNIDNVEASLANAEIAASGMYDAIDNLVLTKLSSVFDGDTDTMLDFADALEQAGFSTEYLANLSDTQLIDLANAWIQCGGDIEKALDQVGLSSTETFEGIYNQLRSMGSETFAKFLSDVGMTVDDFATTLERAGITTDQLTGDIEGDFDALLLMAGGDIDKLIYLINNYNSTPIMDKEGNVDVSGTEILLYANGEIYTWNGQQLKDQSGTVYMTGVSELHDANGEVYTWNESGQLVDQHGNVIIDYTELYDANEEMYEFNGTNLVKDGVIYVDQLQLTDAYDNVVKLEGEELVNAGVNGTVYVNYSEVEEALGLVNELMVNESATKTINVKTVYSTVGSPGGGGGGTAATNPYSYTPSNAISAYSAAVKPVAIPLQSKYSYSDVTDAMRTANPKAATLAASPSAVSGMASSLVRSTVSSLPGNRRSLSEARSGMGGEVIQNYYEVTVDGVGTSSRVQQITLDLLDQLEKEARL